jgi:hypothetical protein
VSVPFLLIVAGTIAAILASFVAVPADPLPVDPALELEAALELALDELLLLPHPATNARQPTLSAATNHVLQLRIKSPLRETPVRLGSIGNNCACRSPG